MQIFVMLNVVMLSVVYAEYHKNVLIAECSFVKCPYAECLYADCCYAIHKTYDFLRSL
jgi:hypothetical protein